MHLLIIDYLSHGTLTVEASAKDSQTKYFKVLVSSKCKSGYLKPTSDIRKLVCDCEITNSYVNIELEYLEIRDGHACPFD